MDLSGIFENIDLGGIDFSAIFNNIDIASLIQKLIEIIMGLFA